MRGGKSNPFASNPTCSTIPPQEQPCDSASTIFRSYTALQTKCQQRNVRKWSELLAEHPHHACGVGGDRPIIEQSPGEPLVRNWFCRRIHRPHCLNVERHRTCKLSGGAPSRRMKCAARAMRVFETPPEQEVLRRRCPLLSWNLKRLPAQV